MENTRRSFLKKMTAAGIGTAGLALSSNAAAATVTTETGAEKKKKPAGKDDGKLRFGFIGTGSRCHEHINNVLSIPGNKIVAICDIQAGPIQRTLDHIAKFNVPAPKVYTGSEREFEKMLNNEEFDCVIIASPWEWHVPMSVAAMKAGVPYVGVEVSAANTLEECWDLVNVSEATGSHLNIMENVCYRRDCMAALNMVRKGLFGELIHARCGYEHDLRDVKFNDGQHYTTRKAANCAWVRMHMPKPSGVRTILFTVMAMSIRHMESDRWQTALISTAVTVSSLCPLWQPSLAACISSL